MGKIKEIVTREVEKQRIEDRMYINIARVISERSHDEKYKVGAVVARGNQILSYGWNGTPQGMDNETRNEVGATRWEVIHAESNALCKLASSTTSSEGATLYCTLSPCTECSKLLLQAGIKRVVYAQEYQPVAIKFLRDNGVKVERHRDYERD